MKKNEKTQAMKTADYKHRRGNALGKAAAKIYLKKILRENSHINATVWFLRNLKQFKLQLLQG